MNNNQADLLRPKHLVILMAGLMFCGTLQASEQDALTLVPVKVTANTITPELNSVDAEQIEKLQATDLEDLFSQSPEVTVSGGADIGQKLYIRGVEDQLLNITIDGAQQATRLFHHAGRISIEPELLKSVEVNAGAGNALSGPGALGGSVKFVTKDPEDMLKPGEDFGGLVKGMFSSNTDSFKTHTSLFGRLNNAWSAMVSYTQADFDNYEDGNGDEVIGTSADQDYLFAKVVGQLTESQTLRLSYEKREDEGNRLQRPNWGQITPRNMLNPIDSERETVTLNYGLNPLDNPYLDLSLTVFNTETDLTQTTRRFGTFVGSGESKGFDLRNTSVLGMHSVTYGVDYREDETVAQGDGEGATDESTVKGAYIQDDIQLTEALLLSAGLRYDDYEFDNDFGNTSFDESELSHNIGINYDFTDHWRAFASYAEAFKGQQAQDAFKVGYTTIDPALKPEDADNVELGFAYESRTWFGSAKVYRSNIDDVVGDNDYDSIFENIGDLESDGLILELGRRWQNVLARVSYHHNDAEIDGYEANAYDHAGIANMVRDTLIAQLDYQFNPQWHFGWNARFVKGRDDVKSPELDLYAPGNSFDQPGYGIHDFYIQWRPASSEDIRVGLTVRNIFDKNYLDHASVADFTQAPGYELIRGYNEPGRDVRLSVAWQF